jgi:acyl-CoA synthetase (NDP forming)
MTDMGHELRTSDAQIPVYAFPENAARALGKAADYAEWRAAPEARTWTFDDIAPDRARALCQAVIAARGTDWLTREETDRVLDAFGLYLVPSLLTHSADEAVSVARVMGYPVVAKLLARGVTHKTDVGGVKSHLMNDDGVRAAFTDLTATAAARALHVEGVCIQRMSQNGIETMVGIARDAALGPLVGFGLGGIDVDIIGDLHFGLAPLDDRDIARLIQRSRVQRLLAGYRGRPPADREALCDVLSRVSALADTVPEVLELDFNPAMVMPAGRGVELVDVRIKVGASRIGADAAEATGPSLTVRPPIPA